MVNLDKKVSIDLKGKMINEILDEVFRDTDVKYAINNRQIILSAKEWEIRKLSNPEIHLWQSLRLFGWLLLPGVICNRKRNDYRQQLLIANGKLFTF